MSYDNYDDEDKNYMNDLDMDDIEEVGDDMEEGEDDEFENQVNQMVEKHYQEKGVKQSNRPESRKSRIQSGESKQNQQNVLQQKAKEQVDRNEIERQMSNSNIFEKFSNAIERVETEFGGFQIEDFWTSNERFVNEQQFRNFITDEITEIFGENEIQELVQKISDDHGLISQKELEIAIPFWNKQQNKLKISTMQAESLSFAQNKRKKIKAKRKQKEKDRKNRKRPRTALTYKRNKSNLRPVSGISTITKKSQYGTSHYNFLTDNTKSRVQSGVPRVQSSVGRSIKNRIQSGKPKQRINSGYSKNTKSFTKSNYMINKSQMYIRQKKQARQRKEVELDMMIAQQKQEFQYECMVKMGEANTLCKGLGQPFTYMAYKTPEGVLKCHKYRGTEDEEEKSGFEKEMRLEDFIKEYNTLLLSYNKQINVNYWERLNQTNVSQVMIQQTDDINANNWQKFDMPIKEKKNRQKALKNILLLTINQIDQLEQQLTQLEDIGINTKNKQKANRFGLSSKIFSKY